MTYSRSMEKSSLKRYSKNESDTIGKENFLVGPMNRLDLQLPIFHLQINQGKLDVAAETTISQLRS